MNNEIFITQNSTIKTNTIWKWLLIILLAIALPFFFSVVRDTQIQQALMNSSPEVQTQQNQNEEVRANL